LTKIKKVKTPLRCYCNSGYQDTYEMGNLNGFPEKVWFNEGSLANILSFSVVSKYNRITVDTEKEQAFIIHRKNGTKMKFVLSKYGLYYHDVRWKGDPTAPGVEYKKRKEAITMIQNTVEENKKNYTARQIKAADLAKRVYGLVGRPSEADFYKMIENNMLANCPIHVSDAKRAVRIYGKDIFALKGKMTRETSPIVQTSIIVPIPKEILEAHKSVTLCADIAYVNKTIIFVTISKNILFMTIEDIPNQKQKNILPCIDQVRKLYKCQGF
jgi:hypothetical protein